MPLAIIRRLLIGVVGLCLLVNLILLIVAWVGSSGASAQSESYTVIAWVEKADVAVQLEKELTGAGHTVTRSQEQRAKQVPAGFKLVLPTHESLLLDAAEETLKYKKIPVKREVLSSGKEELRIDRIFKTRQEAEKYAAMVRQKTNNSVALEVAQNTRPVPTKFEKLVVEKVAGDELEQLKASLEAKGAEVEARPDEAG
ncbi:MAG TPA: hypothetical protein VNO81_09165 [Candidatus Nitrosotenuis sp.]|nr:hypothetical protein [Candidatus Nitrosotenuis sp.]